MVRTSLVKLTGNASVHKHSNC